jgi:hypothetical protein
MRRLLVSRSASVIATTAPGRVKKDSQRFALPAAVLGHKVLPVSVATATTPSVPLSSTLAK